MCSVDVFSYLNLKNSNAEGRILLTTEKLELFFFLSRNRKILVSVFALTGDVSVFVHQSKCKTLFFYIMLKEMTAVYF